MRYAVLLEVEILHDYHLNLGDVVHEATSDALRQSALGEYLAKSFVGVSPTRGTERILAGQQMLFKATARGFLIGVKLDPTASDERPMVPLSAGLSLAFCLKIEDPRFFNYTELSGAASELYRFGNDVANVTAGKRFLSSAVPAFEPARAYQAGEIRAALSGAVVNLFRAVRDTGPSATPNAADWQRIPADTWEPSVTYTVGSIVLSNNRLFRARLDSPGTDLDDAGDWEALGVLANQYVTSTDRVGASAGLFRLDVSSAALAELTLRVFAVGAVAPVLSRRFSAPSGTLTLVDLDLLALRPGLYRVEVLDAALNPVPSLASRLYLDPDATRANWFGVIELGLGSGDSALLDGTGALRSPRYTLRFLNRATRWRYIFPKPQTLGPGAEVAPEGGDARVLVTAATLPLTRFGAGVRLQSDNPATTTSSEEVLLPRAEPERIRRQNAQWYSEIHTLNLQL